MTTPFDRVRSWLHQWAWPFWSEQGVDRRYGGFVERLDMTGRDAGVPFKRTRAHARQVFCFSQAALCGNRSAAAISDHGWEFLDRHGRRPDGGWARKMGREGGILDATSDAYDLAFILFAHAWRYRLTGDEALIGSALATLDVLDQELRHASGIGWLAEAGDTGPRQQNPHMHIMEAAIELADATGHPRFYALGCEVAGLMRARLLERPTGALREFFAADWSLLNDGRGDIVEPGHQYEWTWILLRAQRILGIDFDEEAQLLYDFANRHGVDPVTGLVYDQLNAVGKPLSRDSRSWPQTEALKAHLAMLEFNDRDTTAQINRTVANIFAHYLSHEPIGTWIDHRRHDGSARVDGIPSTTLYHLQLAFIELLRLQERIEKLEQGSSASALRAS